MALGFGPLGSYPLGAQPLADAGTQFAVIVTADFSPDVIAIAQSAFSISGSSGFTAYGQALREGQFSSTLSADFTPVAALPPPDPQWYGPRVKLRPSMVRVIMDTTDYDVDQTIVQGPV
jgi:hypothetical protein